MKYIFIGGGRGGYELISSARANEVLPEYSVICKEDDHENINYSGKIRKILSEKGFGCEIKKKLSGEEYDIIKKFRPDLIFVFGWRTMIDTELNSYCKHGIYAAHFSLLPKYRGFAPLQWSIINGDKFTGVTIFRIENGGVDSGRILVQKKVEIKSGEYAYDVERKLTGITVKLFMDLISKRTIKSDDLKKQDESSATYTCKRIPEDGRINWFKTSTEIYNIIRALAYPYTGAACFHKEMKFVIRKAEPGKMNKAVYSGRIPGRVIDIDESGIEVLCGSGSLKITEWENTLTGKTEVPSSKVRSFSDTLL